MSYTQHDLYTDCCAPDWSTFVENLKEKHRYSALYRMITDLLRIYSAEDGLDAGVINLLNDSCSHDNETVCLIRGLKGKWHKMYGTLPSNIKLSFNGGEYSDEL